MQKEKKLDKIESISKGDLFKLLDKLILKMGYSNIEKDNSFISAKLVGPIFTGKHGFIYLEDKLSGNVEFTPIINKINHLKEKFEFSVIFIVSQFNISKGFSSALNSHLKLDVVYLDRDELIKQIEVYIPEYWKHDDVQLLSYEKNYCESILQESELKSLKIFSDKYQKILNIFIEPKIVHYDEDNETKTPTKKTISIEQIIKDKKPIILSGAAGMGKSTLLKRIGETIILNNEKAEKKNLPVFISVTELFQSNYDVVKVLKNLFLKHFSNLEFNSLYNDYLVTILIDSIDEFEIEHQKKIVRQLNNLYLQDGIKYILGTRSSEKGVLIEDLRDYKTYNIARFNNRQIEQFVDKFFYNQEGRAQKLIEALKENRIIEKLPITPLSLSLISILYEENDREIPATITDIYDNFNSLLLGRAMVSSKIEFIDISFKERILSLYALEVLKRKEHNPMSLDEFKNHFKQYFASKTIPLKKGSLDDLLNYLIENTGIIYLKNNTYVAFNHDSFMEYYAAVEIFKHQRSEEETYVKRFFDMNWQNSAVFYAGHSKDMPVFLNAINEKLKSANQLNDYFSAINGSGYILQALFQTDNLLRKETIEIALEVNVRALELFIKLSSDEKLMFKSFKLPIIWLMNLLFFFENFNSGTLKEPLKLAFKDIQEKYLLESSNTGLGYKALSLALTLNSNRINEKQEIEDLVFNSPILTNNILTIISEISLDIISKGDISDVKKEVKKEYKKIKSPLKHLLETPASKLRFSPYDSINSSKRIKIITEGKTDASIIEHAFMVLVNGETPYWSVKPSGNDNGSAREVNKLLMSAKSIIQEDEIYIGIFDHDGEGIKEFNMLSNSIFNSIKNNTIKKHKDVNVYAILLPVPGEKSYYLLEDQIYNYFEIEHYLPIEFLRNNDALKETVLTDTKGIYRIKDSKKNKLMNKVGESSDPELFSDFIHLFNEIDEITGYSIDYE